MPAGSESDRRVQSRVEVYAQAEIRGTDVHIMAVRNLSAGGVYLVGTAEEYPDFKPGMSFDLVIFGTEDGIGDEQDFNIVCKARIIRVDPGWPGKRPPGFGVTIDPSDQEQRDRLSSLLLRASSFRAGAP